MGIGGFPKDVGGDGSEVGDGELDVKEMNGDMVEYEGEFDVFMDFIGTGDEPIEGIPPIHPNKEDIVYKPFPEENGVLVWLGEDGFDVGHEDVGIGGCAFCSHGSTLDLKIVLIQKIEVVVLKDEVEEV